MSFLRPIDQWFIDEVLPHERHFVAIARRFTRNADDAADLVQEAFVKLFAMDGWSAIANPRGYVGRMIYNLAVEKVRRARIVDIRQMPDLAALELADDAPDGFRVAAGKDEVARMHRALAALPQRCRTVFVRRRFNEELPREIAGDLGISLSTYEKRFARALELLTRALTPVEKAPEAAPADQQSGDAQAN